MAHTVLVDVFLDSPYHIRSIEALSLKVSLATFCGVGRYQNSNIVTSFFVQHSDKEVCYDIKFLRRPLTLKQLSRV